MRGGPEAHERGRAQWGSCEAIQLGPCAHLFVLGPFRLWVQLFLSF